MRMVDLAAALHLSPSGLTRRLDRLARHGYIDRVASVDDRRVMLAVLTDRGFAKLLEAYPTHLASVRRRVFDRCSRTDVAALGRVFGAIQKGLCEA
jgi:DNA-binding MarR family transcriptional regulator